MHTGSTPAAARTQTNNSGNKNIERIAVAVVRKIVRPNENPIQVLNFSLCSGVLEVYVIATLNVSNSQTWTPNNMLNYSLFMLLLLPLLTVRATMEYSINVANTNNSCVECKLDCFELIKYNGYAAERHSVNTADGYAAYLDVFAYKKLQFCR